MSIIKTVNRNINTNRETNNYRCKYGNKNEFDILRVNITYNGETYTYEIESKYLNDTDSIHFYAYPNESSLNIVWGGNIGEHIKLIGGNEDNDTNKSGGLGGIILLSGLSVILCLCSF